METDGDQASEVKLPLLYRLLLKLPAPNLSSLYADWPWLEGIVAAIILPCLVVACGWITLWIWLSAPFGFPFNFFAGLSITFIILVFWARIQVERTLNAAANLGKSQTYNVSKSVQEYMELLDKQRNRKQGKS